MKKYKLIDYFTIAFTHLRLFFSQVHIIPVIGTLAFQMIFQLMTNKII